ncbi:SMI1/KNR4 family protein [Amycolatopsis sp. NPDC004169]|uniref:SMI1/KNR4 family protein n=1 Tax=Amycolatopsis sp. NPDC004169 TaxID=3154453 RepID=UPI0033BCCA5F
MWPGVSVSGTGGVVAAADIAAFSQKHGMPLPGALAELYREAGVGTFGGFLHFEAPDEMCTHRELIEDLIDEDDEEELAPTADVIVFARTDNRDMCGWHAADLAAGEDRVVRLDGFDEEPLAGSTRRFLDGLPGTDYFGFGVLAPTYRRHDWRA